MKNDFQVGEKIKVTNFFGKVICESEVAEITNGGNIRIKAYKELFRPDGSERRKVLFDTDRIYINKV